MSEPAPVDRGFFEALHEKTQGRLAGDIPLSEFRFVGGPYGTDDGQPGPGQGYLLTPRRCATEEEWLALDRPDPPTGPIAEGE